MQKLSPRRRLVRIPAALIMLPLLLALAGCGNVNDEPLSVHYPTFTKESAMSLNISELCGAYGYWKAQLHSVDISDGNPMLMSQYRKNQHQVWTLRREFRRRIYLQDITLPDRPPCGNTVWWQ